MKKEQEIAVTNQSLTNLLRISEIQWLKAKFSLLVLKKGGNLCVNFLLGEGGYLLWLFSSYSIFL